MGNLKSFLTLCAVGGLLSMNATAQAPNWKDSYSVGGKCYCDSSNFDHGLDTKTAPTPIGELNVKVICADIKAVLGEGPTANRLPYNDIQCGNGPANDADDESYCPGRVDLGEAGCNIIGPKWDLISVYGPGSNTPDDYLDRSGWNLSASSNEQNVYNAIDGSSSSRWATGTVQTSGQYFQIDLGGQESFETIILETPGNPSDYPREYHVYVSNNGVNWGNPIASGAGNSSTTRITFNAVTASHLLIEQTGSDSGRWWSIAEINLVESGDEPQPSPTPTPTITPPNGPIDRSAWELSSNRSVGGSYAISNAIDSNTNSRWATQQAQIAGQYFQVDLGNVYNLDQIELRTPNNPNDYPREYEVIVSNDGSSWTSPVASGFGDGPITTIDLTASARFVRITQLGSSDRNWWSIDEINIYAGDSSTGETTQLNDSSWTFSASNESDNPANANDGSSASRWSTRETQRNGQYFQIDMQSTETFSRIVLDSAASNLDQPRGYEVLVSNNANDWSSPVATGSGDPDGLTQIDFSEQSARFVRIVQTGSDSRHWWSIHELDVYLVD